MKNASISILILVALTSLHCKPDDSGPDRAQAARSRDAAGAVTKGISRAETVTMTTEDNVVITGTLYAASGGNQPAVLCLHQWRSDRSRYADLADVFNSAGITVLAIDMRGHGDSRRKTDGSKVDPDRMATADVAAAVAFLRKTPGVDEARIGILGASYGSSNALIYAADHPDIKALALLSPGLNYFNVLPTEPAVLHLKGTPVLALASADDFRSVEAVKRYQEIMAGSITGKLLKNAGHGTDMFTTEPNLLSELRDFFAKNLR